MRKQVLASLLSLLTIQVIGSEVSKVEKIEKYLGQCEIVGYSTRAHLTYISETGYEDGFSNTGVIVEFTNEKGNLVSLTDKISRMSIAGFKKEVKFKNKWNKFEVEKDGNMFGGTEGYVAIDKVKKSGKISYEYKCFQGSNCGEYKIKLALTKCDLDFTLNGKKIK